MKKLILLITLSLLLLSSYIEIPAFAGMTEVAKADTVWEDLILNPSFEDSAGQKSLKYWTPTNSIFCNDTIPLFTGCFDTTTPPGGGNYSVKVWTGVNVSRNSVRYMITQECKGIFRLRFWMKSKYDDRVYYTNLYRVIPRASLFIQGQDSFFSYPRQQISTQWQEFIIIDTLNLQRTDTFYIGLGIYNNCMGCSGHVDLVHFEKLKEL